MKTNDPTTAASEEVINSQSSEASAPNLLGSEGLAGMSMEHCLDNFIARANSARDYRSDTNPAPDQSSDVALRSLQSKLAHAEKCALQSDRQLERLKRTARKRLYYLFAMGTMAIIALALLVGAHLRPISAGSPPTFKRTTNAIASSIHRRQNLPPRQRMQPRKRLSEKDIRERILNRRAFPPPTRHKAPVATTPRSISQARRAPRPPQAGLTPRSKSIQKSAKNPPRSLPAKKRSPVTPKKMPAPKPAPKKSAPQRGGLVDPFAL